MSVAVAAVIAIATVFTMMARRPLQRLSGAIKTHRPIEGRIVGLRWARYEPGSRTRGDRRGGRDLGVVVAASAVLISVENDRDRSSRHVSAIARLLLGDDVEAAQALDELAQEAPSDPHVLSDAAVAHLVSAKENDRPHELPMALAAADRALRIDPLMPEALFNRAVLLEHLGLSRHAAVAWRRFLDVEGSGAWADEARVRSGRFGGTLAESYERQAVVAESAAVAGDHERVRAIVNAYRQEARTTAEAELGRWAEAESRGDFGQASRLLTSCRGIGAALREVNGDEFVSATVAAIDAADAANRLILIRAHMAYHKGRILFADGRPSEAEPLLMSASLDFEAAGSPASWAGRYFHANTLAAMRRGDESYETLRTLAATIAADRFRALDAQIHWDLGLAEVVRGNWTAAERAYQRSADGFASLGESGNLGFVESLQAEIDDYLGDRERAWRRRLASFPLLTQSGRGNRLQVAIGTAARAELRAGFPSSALPLFDLEIAETAFASGGEVRLASAYARRAMLHATVGDERAAAADLAAARDHAAKLSDTRVKSFVEGVAATAEAVLIRSTKPAASLAMLDHALAMTIAADQRLPLPKIQLERARALLQLGNQNAAIAVYREGIDELERQRDTVLGLDQRVGVFDTGQALFVEVTELLLRRGEVEQAFAFAERGRARTLVESTALRRSGGAAAAASLRSVQAALADGDVLVEYAIVPRQLKVFAITKERIDIGSVEIGEADLRVIITRFAKSARNRAPMPEVEEAASRAYDLLVKPVATTVRGARTIVFVPDRFLQLVPFAALRGGGKYLIEDHAVVVSPSAQIFAEAIAARRSPAERDALVFGNPSTGGAFEDLQESEREARTVAAAYQRPMIAIGVDATRETFFTSFGKSVVVHFAGHATIDPSRGATAALAFSGRTGADLVAAHEIARIAPGATRLVVLAACDTFSGTREHFEGTPTLAHAFLATGVPSVVGTLWPVGDAASQQLFGNFHRLFARGIDGAESLREAQLAMLHNQDATLRHPAAWSAAEVLGSSLAIRERKKEQR